MVIILISIIPIYYTYRSLLFVQNNKANKRNGKEGRRKITFADRRKRVGWFTIEERSVAVKCNIVYLLFDRSYLDVSTRSSKDARHVQHRDRIVLLLVASLLEIFSRREKKKVLLSQLFRKLREMAGEQILG